MSNAARRFIIPRSMVILVGRVLVGRKQIRMDLGVRSRRETGENEYRLNLLKSFAIKELRKGVITTGRKYDQKQICVFNGRNKKLI